MLVQVETSLLESDAINALVAGTKDPNLLDELSSIKSEQLVRRILRNPYVSSDTAKKLYEKYAHSQCVADSLIYCTSTPGGIVVDLLKSYKNKFGRAFGEVPSDLFYNENLSTKDIDDIYSLYKNGAVLITGNRYKLLVRDRRTSVEVLKDVLRHEPDDEILCIIARHPKMKIVSVDE